MPAVITIAAYAIPAIVGAVSSHKQANASKEAAKTLSTAETQAAGRSENAMNQMMAYTMANQQATAQSYAPYIQAGQNSMAKLGRGLGLPPMLPQAGPTAPNMGAPTQNMGSPGQNAMLGPQQGGGMVTIQFPDGSTRQVDAAMAAKYPYAKRLG